MKRKAIIISIKSFYLSSKEKKLISREKPWGIILFKRNIRDFNQTKKLINSIKVIVKDKNYPILIDEEGGTVTRLSKFVNNKIFSQKYFGDIYLKNNTVGLTLYRNYINSICKIFKELGININTVPVLDVLNKNTTKILKDRCYSSNLKVIKTLGKLCEDQYKKNKIGTVIKHIPGHGSTSKDSHKELPIINKSVSKLMKSDFSTFFNSKSFFAMTAHVVYKKFDKDNVTTFSNTLIKEIIRNKMKFNGILISDDISMSALSPNLISNASKSLKSGCNLALYCAGKYSESLKLLKAIPFVDKFTQKKTSEFYKFLS